MYQQPLVSIVVPCYNAEKWIWDCLLSIIKQDYDNIEIIVVDDASTDNSINIINQFKQLFGGVKLISNGKNIGECATSTRGFSESCGIYICRLSADDTFVLPSHLTEQINEMEKYNLDWCYNNINLIGKSIESAKEYCTSWVPIPIRFSAKLLYIFDNIILQFPNLCYLIAITQNPVNSSSLMFRAGTYKKYLEWDDKKIKSCCDGALLSKIYLLRLKGRAIHKIGSFYRIHNEQATGKPETNKDLLKMRNMMCEKIKYGNYPTWMKICSRIIEVSCGI